MASEEAGGNTGSREESLALVVESITFRSDDGRFAVARARRSQGNAPIVLVGPLGATSVGEELRVRGRFETHPVHGLRFQVRSYLPILPTTKEGLTRFLGSGLVSGIGPSTAKRIVDRFGERTLDVVCTQRAKLLEVKGVGRKRAEQLAEVVRERRLEAEQLSFLRSVGLGPAIARRVLKRYQEHATHQLKEDPYLVAEQVDGVGFATADEIGRALGIGLEDPRRVAGAILHLLGKAADAGHVLLPREELSRHVAALDIEPGLIPASLQELSERKLVVLEEDDVYVPPLHRAEVRLAGTLQTLDVPSSQTEHEIESALFSASEVTDTQRQAVEASLRHRLTLLTGGPGTGKTTTVRAIVDAHRSLSRRVVLCAPTGRAAKRMMEATGAEAKTIHRLLEWVPFSSGSKPRFQRGPDSPIEADLVLVDEASMLDLRLADQLIGALAPNTSLVLVGDVAQLPPVGAGHVLQEVLRSGIGKRIHLQEIFRQAQASAIVRSAHAVLQGQMPTPSGAETRSGNGDLFFIKAPTPERMLDRLIASLERIRVTYQLDPKQDVQVLTPMRKGPVGAEQLNEHLQEHFLGVPTAGRFLPGDRVMQLRNDYDKEVFNGDLGRVERVDGDIVYVAMDVGTVSYRAKETDALALAYASTVHKVQGSEFPAIIVLLHGSHHILLDRALLYTAITRARRLAIIIGDDRALRRAVRNEASYHGHCRLAERVRMAR